jgi:hypothetical protein
MTYRVAQEKVAQYLATRGELIREKQVSAKRLANWRRYPPGKKRS